MKQLEKATEYNLLVVASLLSSYCFPFERDMWFLQHSMYVVICSEQYTRYQYNLSLSTWYLSECFPRAMTSSEITMNP